MKQSLRNSISLFDIKDQLKIYIALFALKLRIKPPDSFNSLFYKCMAYVKAHEAGVNLGKAQKDLIKATLVINSRTIAVYLRSNSSDLQVLESVLLHDEYKPAVKQLLDTTKQKNIRQIIDAGGNIGLTSIYFHCFFPDAHFTIIEPDERNFSLLKKNIDINGVKNKLLLKNALWVNSEPLVIEDLFRDGKEWSLTVGQKVADSKNQKRTELLGITLKEICERKNNPPIDLFKIDIEGAERFLFSNSEFLETINSCVENLVIEIHDEFKIRDIINSEMHEMNFTKEEYGDITLFAKQFSQS